MPMITAPVTRAIEELLRGRGIEQKPGELLGDYVARGLGISASQAETFLERLHQGRTLEEAMADAGISGASKSHDLLVEVARAIGTALGKLSR